MASSGDKMTAVHGGVGTQGTPANNVGGERRPSQGAANAQGGLFSGLMNQKRNSTDATATARRKSFAEQKPSAGVIGQMWNNFTTGGNK